MGRDHEERLSRLARGQFGLVTTRQCVLIGVSTKQIKKHVATGAWVELQPRVLKLGLGRPTLDELDFAVLLAAGKAAVLSHFSAARRWKIDVPRFNDVHVTIPATQSVPRGMSAKIRRSRLLLPTDLTLLGPFRLTRPVRTVIDLATELDERWLRVATDGLFRRHRGNFEALRLAVDAQPKRAGLRPLRELLREYTTASELPDSALESLAMELGLFTGRRPILHFVVSDPGRPVAEVDFAWPDIRLAIELDGYAFHGSHAAFVHDRARDRALAARGWTVLRFTWEDIHKYRDRTLSEVLRVLSLRSSAQAR